MAKEKRQGTIVAAAVAATVAAVAIVFLVQIVAIVPSIATAWIVESGIGPW